MNQLAILFRFGFTRRIKDSFLVSYGIFMPLIMLSLLGYLSMGYYTGLADISSYSYYTLVSLPLYTFFSTITLIYVAREEKRFHCGERFIMAPIPKYVLVLYKILPSTLVLALFNSVVLIFTTLVFKINLGGHFLSPLILLIAFGYLSCALGTYIGLCSKNFMVVKNFVSTPLLIMGFLGGSFFPIGSLGKGFELASYLSPLTYINRGLFMLLYDQDFSFYYVALILTLILSIIFTCLTATKLQKEAFI